MMTIQFNNNEPVSKHMQFPLEQKLKPFWPELLKSGLSLVAIDAATNKVTGVILAWDGATPDNWGVCFLCQLFCSLAPHMTADSMMCNEFVESITNSKLDKILMEFGK